MAWLLEWSFFRYLLTGAGLFLIDLAVFMTCTLIFGLEVWLGQIISRTVGAIVGFFGHKYFSFHSKREHSRSLLALQSSVYILITIFNILFSPIVVCMAVEITHGKLISAKIITEIIFVGETYILLRILFVTSRKKRCKL